MKATHSIRGRALNISRYCSLTPISLDRLAQIANPRLDSLEARIAELEYQTRPQAPDSDPVLEQLRQLRSVRSAIESALANARAELNLPDLTLINIAEAV